MSQQTVAHYVNTYLFRNGTWIYGQIAHIQRWRPIILCDTTENLDFYPVSPIYSLADLAKKQRIYNQMIQKIIGYTPFHLNAQKEEDANIIHAHFGYSGHIILPLVNKCKVPLVTTFYGSDLSRLPKQDIRWRGRYKRLFSQGHLFLVEGTHMRYQLIDLGCPADKIKVQHLGVNLDKLHFMQRQPYPNGDIRILIAATFTEKKGLPYAIEAFGRVCKNHKNLHLTVIGDARDRPEELVIKDKVYTLVKQYDISSQVTFMGFQPYSFLIEQFYQHHLFLSPSVQAEDGDNEGGAPVTIIEASATGMPILSTTHCDIPEVVRDGVSGYLVPERDIDTLADRLTQLTSNPGEWSNMGLSGRKHIEQNYNVFEQSRNLETLYDQVITQ